MASALTGGCRLAFGIGAGLIVAAIVTAVTVLRPRTAVQLEPAVESELPAPGGDHFEAA